MSERPAKRPRSTHTAHYVALPRPEGAQEARMQLPVCMHEQEIMEAIEAHEAVVITGATGSGKTTQLPQFLLEAGFGDPESTRHAGCVAVTQPRRVAAVSCARRVASEVGSPVGGMVGFHVRHRPEYGPETRVKFVTDGILLREAQEDLLLSKYSAVVIDEAHERTLNTDILLALLSRTISLRKEAADTTGTGTPLHPLKLIVMSATLDIDGIFAGPGSLFPSAPVVNVPARQHPVTVHFSRRTSVDYVQDAFRKVCQIHRKLPAGGVLVFLTGRQEVEDVCDRLRSELGSSVVVLPFFALLDDKSQRRVFDDCGDRRKIVVATNVAETSVTIPGISYVVDSGRAKEKCHRSSGAGLLTSFNVVWISKASAEQRAGRSGRTGPGHCYRLYSSAMFNDHFPKFRPAEVLRVPADSVVLRLRAMGIRHIHQFPFPTKPEAEAISGAESLLGILGALDDAPVSEKSNSAGSSVLGVTPIGRALSSIPVPPRIGRMLLASCAVKGCLPYAARAAALLSLGEILEHHREGARSVHSPFAHPKSDVLTSLRALCAVEHTGRTTAVQHGKVGVRGTEATASMRGFCEKLFINFKICVEAIAIAEQLESCVEFATTVPTEATRDDGTHATEDVDEESPAGAGLEKERKVPLPPMSEDIETGLLRAFLCGFPDQVARRMTVEEAAVLGIIPRRRKLAFTACSCDEPVFLESRSSVVLEEENEYVCFGELASVSQRLAGGTGQDIGESPGSEDEVSDAEANVDEDVLDSDVVASKARRNDSDESTLILSHGQVQTRLVLRGVSAISSQWLSVDARTLCRFSSSKSSPAPLWDSKTSKVVRVSHGFYGPRRWPLGSVALPVGTYRVLVRTREPESATVAANARREEGLAFASAIVKGVVFAELAPFAEGCDSGGGRVAVFASLLTENGIETKEQLVSMMNRNASFACKEYCDCLSRRMRQSAGKHWNKLGNVQGPGRQPMKD